MNIFKNVICLTIYRKQGLEVKIWIVFLFKEKTIMSMFGELKYTIFLNKLFLSTILIQWKIKVITKKKYFKNNDDIILCT